MRRSIIEQEHHDTGKRIMTIRDAPSVAREAASNNDIGEADGGIDAMTLFVNMERLMKLLGALRTALVRGHWSGWSPSPIPTSMGTTSVSGITRCCLALRQTFSMPSSGLMTQSRRHAGIIKERINKTEVPSP